jgi:hypothetical protein
LRIVLLPAIGHRFLWGESDFLLYYHMVESWLAQHPDLFVYFVVPDSPAELPDLPRVRWLSERWTEAYYDKVACVGGTFLELFNPRRGKFVADAVLTSRTISAIQIARVLWDFRHPDLTIPVFVHEPKAVGFEDAHQVVMDLEVAARVMGYAFSYPIFDTEKEKTVALGAARHYLQPAWALRVIERSLVNPCGVPCDEIDERTKGLQPNADFTVLFGGRINTQSKKIDTVVEVMESFFASGRKVRLEVLSPNSGKLKGFLRYNSVVKFRPRTDYREFWQRAKQAQVFLSFSEVEGFTVGVLEQLYMGLVGILPRKPWVKAILKDKYESYPFLHDGEKSARELLERVYTDYAGARASIGWLPGWIREQYDCRTVNEVEYQHIVRNSNHDYSILSKGNVGLIRQSLDKLGDRFTLDDIWRVLLGEASYRSTEPPNKGQLSRFFIYRWLCRNGFVDTVESDVPTFRRIR